MSNARSAKSLKPESEQFLLHLAGHLNTVPLGDDWTGPKIDRFIKI